MEFDEKEKVITISLTEKELLYLHTAVYEDIGHCGEQIRSGNLGPTLAAVLKEAVELGGQVGKLLEAAALEHGVDMGGPRGV